jgi:hypothetical protein
MCSRRRAGRRTHFIVATTMARGVYVGGGRQGDRAACCLAGWTGVLDRRRWGKRCGDKAIRELGQATMLSKRGVETSERGCRADQSVSAP